MGCCRVLVKVSAVVVALVAVLVGCVVADVPGQVGLWRYLDSIPYTRGMIPIFHQGPWAFNHSSLAPDALVGRTILVTGANSGLGLSTSEILAAHGATVIMACRLQSNCDTAAKTVQMTVPNAKVIPMVLDLASFKSIKSFADEVIKTTPKLHSLILNAALFFQPYGLTEDGFQVQIGVNHFGHAYLVQLLEGLLKKSASKELPATVVVVASNSHYFNSHQTNYAEGVRLSLDALNDEKTYTPQQAYGESKLANVLYAQELAKRLRPFGVLVNAVHPGAVATNITTSIWDVLERTAIGSLSVRLGLFAKVKAWVAGLSWNSNDAALTQVYAAVSPEILANRVHGKYFHPVARETTPCLIHAHNETLQKELWEFTEEVIKSRAK